MSVGEGFVVVGALVVIVTGVNWLLIPSIAEGSAARLERQSRIRPFTYFAGWDAAKHERFLRRWVVPLEFALGVLLMLIGAVILLASSAP